jgi:hypothetical protein
MAIRRGAPRSFETGAPFERGGLGQPVPGNCNGARKCRHCPPGRDKAQDSSQRRDDVFVAATLVSTPAASGNRTRTLQPSGTVDRVDQGSRQSPARLADRALFDQIVAASRLRDSEQKVAVELQIAG